jgi:general secretion pathway protein A
MPSMYIITPGIETYAAYAICLLLFSLLVLSVRNRKMAAPRSHHTLIPSLLQGDNRPAPRGRPSKSSRRTPTPVQHSGLLLGQGSESTLPDQAVSKVPDSSPEQMIAPLDFPEVRTSDEVKMNSEFLSSVGLEPVVPVEESTIAGPEPAPTVLENIPVSPAAMAEVAEDSMALTVDAACEQTAPKNFLEFCGLQQLSFDVTPDPAYLFLSPTHRDALTSLKQGIENFRGFMMLVAEPGMGKTTLLNKLMEELSDSARVVFLFQTQCNSRDLLGYILNELEVDHSGMDVIAMHRALNQALLEEMLRGRRFVLIVDEAQNLQEPVLETIRLLSDFETTHSKLIQIVLAGQPQLADTLMRPGLVQLRQRIAVLASLKPLTPDETAEYIEFRLRAAGWKDRLLFSSEALDQIAESSEGVPRRINNLCFNALSLAFDRGLDFVDADIVKEVVGKLNLESLVRVPEVIATPQQSDAPAVSIGASELARAFAAAFAEARPDGTSEPVMGPKPRPGVKLTGNLTEKVRSQGWSKRHEYRILVSLERDLISGLPVADRYYCCSLYVDEAQAAALKPGKPVRIKIEQD